MEKFILLLLFIHFFGDFICQSRWMADNKSKNLLALSTHVLTYTTVLFIALAISIGDPLIIYQSFVNHLYFGTDYGTLNSTNNFFPQIICYSLVNGGLHFCTDFCTSKFTSYFYKKEKWHEFFSVIGFDQFIHQTCLILTIPLLNH